MSPNCSRDTVSSWHRVVDPIVVLLCDVQLPGKETLLGGEATSLPYHKHHVLIRQQPNQIPLSVPVIQGDVLPLELPPAWEKSGIIKGPKHGVGVGRGGKKVLCPEARSEKRSEPDTSLRHPNNPTSHCTDADIKA